MKYRLIFLFFPILMYGQVQIGDDIEGEKGFIGQAFGSSVSISSDGLIMAVGAPLNNDNGIESGHVRVYENIAGIWTQVGEDINGEFSGDKSGSSVSLSANGNIVAIGAPYNDGNGNNAGHVRVYENINGVWTQVGGDIDGESEYDSSGSSVSLSSNGNIVAIGAPYNDRNGDNAGHVRIYKNVGGNWIQIGNDINGDKPLVFLGSRVNLSSDGSILAISSFEDSISLGRISVYENIDDSWVQIGSDIINENFANPFGLSLSLSGNGKVLAIGLIDNLQPIKNSVKIYELFGDNWLQKGNSLKGGSVYEAYGESVSLSEDGNTLIIGVQIYESDNKNVEFGRAEIYKYVNNYWSKVGNDLLGENFDKSYGSSVSISSDGNTVLIGGPRNDKNGFYSGHVRVYQNVNDSWLQVGNDVDGDTSVSPDRLGFNVSLSADGHILAVGSNNADGIFIQSGKVSVYERINNNWEQVGDDLEGASSYDDFGISVSLSSDGNILAVGAPNNDTSGNQSGQVRVYERINDNWVQLGHDINGVSSYDFFGINISLSANGSVLAVGPTYSNGNSSDTGSVKVYQYIAGDWIQLGSEIDGNTHHIELRKSISLSADGSVVAFCVNLPLLGFAIRVYQFKNGDWIQIGNNIYGEDYFDFLISSVDLSANGDILAIGAPRNSNAAGRSGHVRVFKIIENEWIQIGDDIDGSENADRFGVSLSLSSDGTIISIGAAEQSKQPRAPGFASIYKNINNSWIKIGNDIKGEFGGDYFGRSISLSSDASTVAIGAPYNNNNGLYAGLVSVYDLSAILSTQSFEQDYFTYYPNPVKAILNINLNKGLELKQVNIYNLQSQYLYSVKEISIDVSNLSTGIYFVEVVTNQGKSAKKIVIE